jgi:F-type H+-transporting ATPase subunit epsilon
MGIGIATLAAPAQTVYVAISGGVAEVHDNTVTLLAEVAELATEIDTSRAQRAAERARKRLEAAYCGPGGEVIVDVERARTALARAINRLHTAEKAGMLG